MLLGSGYSRTDVARYERGQRLPLLDTAIRLATLYGVSVEFLFPNLVRDIRNTGEHAMSPLAVRREVYTPRPEETRILAIYPSTYRVGVAMFSTFSLEQKAVYKLGQKSTSSDIVPRWAELISQLVADYMPEVIVVERLPDRGARQHADLAVMIKILKKYARHKSIKVYEYSIQGAREALLPEGARMANELLFQLVASQVPELRAYLPKVDRKIGDGVRHFTALFLAVALGLTWLRKHHTPYANTL